MAQIPDGPAPDGPAPDGPAPATGPRTEQSSTDPERHSRQVRFAPIGPAGQEKIRHATVWVVGVGALGSNLAESMARAGIGTLVLIDRDVVELSNLQRQRLFTTADARRGRPKAIAAARRIRAIDPGINVQPHAREFDADLWTDLSRSSPPDLVLDGTDNFAVRFLINDLCGRHGIPWIHGGATGSDGSAMVVLPGTDRPCLRCLVPEPPANHSLATCETHGVLGPTVDAVAAFQAGQALKILSGHRDTTARGMLQLDVWTGRYRIAFAAAIARPDCASCGTGEYPALTAGGERAVALCGRDAVQIRPGRKAPVDLAQLQGNLEHGGIQVEGQSRWLRFTADNCRFTVFPDGRTLIQGCDDTHRAKALFDRYVGLSP